MVGKARQNPLEMALPRKIVNQKQYHIPGGTAEINATNNILKDKKVVILPTMSPFNSPICPVQKTGGSSRMTVDCHKFNQVMPPIAAPSQDGVSLLDQINTFPTTWYAAIWQMHFSPYLLIKIIRSNLLSASKASNISSFSYLWSRSALSSPLS